MIEKKFMKWNKLYIFFVLFLLISCQSIVEVKEYRSNAKIENSQTFNYTDPREPGTYERKVSFKVSYDLIKSPQPPLLKGVMKSGDLKIKALPTTTITKIDVKITGLGIPNPISNSIDISGTPGQFLNITLNLNIPIGKKRIITIKGLDAGENLIAGAELKAVFDVPAGVVDVNWNTTPAAGVYQELLNTNTTRSRLSVEAININDMENFINTIPVVHKSLVNVQKISENILTLNETKPLTENLEILPADGATNLDYKINTTGATINLKDKSGNSLSGIQVLITDPVSSITTSGLDGKATINNIPPGNWKGQIKLSGNVVEEDTISIDQNLNVNLGTLSGDNILDWWHNNWAYKKAITVTNAGGALTDYQVKISIDNSDTNFWNNVKSNGGDIRFIDSDNTTQLNNYWIENFDYTGKTANLWVKIPNIQAGGKTIYLYYGNNGEATTANFDNTFTKNYNDTGLAGLWHFDENGDRGDVIDNSGNGNHGKNQSHIGTLINTSWIFSKYGIGLLFNGVNSYGRVPDSNLWAFGNNSFSITLWANFNVIPPGEKVIIGHDEGGGNSNKWTFEYWSNGLDFHINAPALGPKRIAYYNWIPATGTWYHLAITRSGSTYNLYIDGVNVKTDTNTDAIPNPNAFLTIGQAEGIFINAKLDDICIYNRALSSPEVSNIYNNINIPNGLVADWKFEENAGTTAYDSHLWQNTDGGQWGNRNDIKFASGSNLALNGSTDYVSIPHNNSLQPSNITVEYWIKGTLPQPDPLYLVIDKSHGFADFTGWVMQGDGTTGNIGWLFGDGAGFSNNSVASTSNILDNLWHHVVGTYNGTQLILYIDGVVNATKNTTANIAANNRNVNIGAWWGGGRWFRGFIDEARIYNRALNIDEIKAHYERRKYTLTAPTLNLGQGIGR